MVKYSRLSNSKNEGVLSLKIEETFIEEIEDGIAELESEEILPKAETNLSDLRGFIRKNRIEPAIKMLIKRKIFPTKSKRDLEQAFTKYQRLRKNSLMGIFSQQGREKMMGEIVEAVLENHL